MRYQILAIVLMSMCSLSAGNSLDNAVAYKTPDELEQERQMDIKSDDERQDEIRRENQDADRRIQKQRLEDQQQERRRQDR